MNSKLFSDLVSYIQELDFIFISNKRQHQREFLIYNI